MLDAHPMIRTDNRTLEQTPNAFNSVGVNIANNLFLLRVINPLVLRVGIFNSPTSWHLISINRFGIRCRGIMDELVQRCLVSVGDYLQPNLSGTLHSSNSNSFIS